MKYIAIAIIPLLGTLATLARFVMWYVNRKDRKKGN